MRKVTQEVVGSFNYRQAAKLSNTESTGNALYLHGNKIAEWRDDGLWITNAGWESQVTKERLNGLRAVTVVQKNYQWYLNGKEWDGKWVRVSDHYQGSEKTDSDDGLNRDGLKVLKNVALVAQLGEIFGKTQKEKNDWKIRMLKAGLENKGLIIPDDWDTLSEKEKEQRLNGAIEQIL